MEFDKLEQETIFRELIQATSNINNLTDKIDDLANNHKRIDVELTNLKILLESFKFDNMDQNHQIETMKNDIKDMKKELDEMSKMATKWKGGIAVILFLGSIAGYALSFIPTFLKG